MANIERTDIYNRVVELLQTAKQQIVSTMNAAMVYTYFEIGRIIVEEEQKGERRAEYGKATLKGLSKRLTRIWQRVLIYKSGADEKVLQGLRSNSSDTV